MTCTELHDRFSDYFDGTGDPSFLGDADAHLDGCADCRRYHAILTAGTQILKSAPQLAVSGDFFPRLQHRIFHLEDGPALGSERTGSATTISAAVAIAALIALAAWSPALMRAPRVRLPEIVVTRAARAELAAVPGVRPPQLWTSAAATMTARSVSFTPSVDRQLWDDPAILTRYSPLVAPTVQRVSLGRRADFF